MKTILLIEDNPDILDNLTEYLETEHYQILKASDGKKGLMLAREFIPDLIICDALMPEMSGFEVLSKILSWPETSEIPFIFSTSLFEKMDKQKALRMGADDYIVKPYDLEALLKMAETWMKEGSKRHSTEYGR